MCAERQVWGTALRYLSTRHILDEESEYVRGCQEQSRDLHAMRKEGRLWAKTLCFRGRETVGKSPISATGKDPERKGSRDGQGCVRSFSTFY